MIDRQKNIQIIDVQNLLSVVKSLNEAIFMAATDLGDPAKRDAIQTVCTFMENQLVLAVEHLEEIRGAE